MAGSDLVSNRASPSRRKKETAPDGGSLMLFALSEIDADVIAGNSPAFISATN